jgi:hypothetical protein
LDDPIGITDASGATNCDATTFGWSNDGHSDMKNLPFYTIYRWFKKVFKTDAQIIQ